MTSRLWAMVNISCAMKSCGILLEGKVLIHLFKYKNKKSTIFTKICIKKKTPKKTLRVTFKKLELIWGTADREAKERK